MFGTTSKFMLSITILREIRQRELSHNWASSRENMFLGNGEHNRRRPSCASAQSDQRLCYSLIEKYYMYTCYKRNFNFLASVCSLAGWFEFYFVWNLRRQVFSRRGPIKREREREREIVASKQNCNNKTVILSANNKIKLMEYKNVSWVWV